METLRKDTTNHKRDGNLAEIRMWCFINTSPKLYRCINLLPICRDIETFFQNIWIGVRNLSVGASTSHNPKGLHDLYRDNFTYLTYLK
jgi:hypothetical protein